MGPGSDGPMGGLGGMDSHHMNGSLGKDNTFLLFSQTGELVQFERLPHFQAFFCIQESYNPILLMIGQVHEAL